jgi:hypothetical protein
MNDRRRAAKTQSSCATVAMTGQRLYNAPRVSLKPVQEKQEIISTIGLSDGGRP